ncbi:hypothetical protein [Clostridium sp. K25]|uniref:hypothetical protein n=1 Tax=Clostridium sp. K25 TaxID=1443109 RepID=UPI0004D77836|nr:hypothetical protein [Clostridium sp. K25]KEI06178.1 hypothetical protein Z957_p0152 [Clostridium sp. K25]
MSLRNYTKRFFSASLLTFVLSLGIIAPAYAADVNGFNYGAGDILLTSDTDSIGLLGHTGLVLPDGKSIVHIAGLHQRPTRIHITQWLSRYPHTKVIRHKSTPTRVKAANWAKAYYVDGKGKYTEYKVTPNPKDLKYTYCSEIVWQAYYYGANIPYKVVSTNCSDGVFCNSTYNIPAFIKPYDFSKVMLLDYNGFKIVKEFK